MSMRAADENTEILLTEYIEGTLPSSRKAEIDAYLAAHPKEKEVVDHLLQQRGLLRKLPTEHAPAEIHESIQSQLERSVLLENLADIETMGASPRRFRSQWLTVAALLFLSAGLFTTVYFVISPPKPTATEVAQRSETPASPEKETVPAPEVPEPAHLPSGLANGARGGGAGGFGGGAGGFGGGGANGGFGGGGFGGGGGGGGAGQASGNAGALADAEAAPTRRVVIYTDDLPGTRLRVENLLQSGGWSYLATPPTGAVETREGATDAAAQAVQSPDQDKKGESAQGAPDVLDRQSRERPSQSYQQQGYAQQQYGPPRADLSKARDQAEKQQAFSAVAPTAAPPPTSRARSSSDQILSGNTLLLVRVEGDQADALAAALPRLGLPPAGTLALPAEAASQPAQRALASTQTSEPKPGAIAAPGNGNPFAANNNYQSNNSNSFRSNVVNMVVDIRPQGQLDPTTKPTTAPALPSTLIAPPVLAPAAPGATGPTTQP